jgi:hypothetical protein
MREHGILLRCAGTMSYHVAAPRGLKMKRFIVVGLLSLACIPAWTAESTDSGAANGVAELHTKAITPASNVLFHAESTPPSTAQEWERVRASAAALGWAAQQLALKDLAMDQSEWINFAHALRKQAARAVRAAEKKDQEALVGANGDIVSVCEDCHAQYRDAGRSMKE